VEACKSCDDLEECREAGGSEFIVDFKLADEKDAYHED
jgi:hypothetical protein